MKTVRGSSLIEMVLVIVTSGAVAAVTVPRFIDTAFEEQNAATASLAAVLGSASVMNFAKEKAAAMSGAPIADCQHTAALLDEGMLPGGYHVHERAIPGEEGASMSCTLSGPRTTVAYFRAIKVDLHSDLRLAQHS